MYIRFGLCLLKSLFGCKSKFGSLFYWLGYTYSTLLLYILFGQCLHLDLFGDTRKSDFVFEVSCSNWFPFGLEILLCLWLGFYLCIFKLRILIGLCLYWKLCEYSRTILLIFENLCSRFVLDSSILKILRFLYLLLVIRN